MVFQPWYNLSYNCTKFEIKMFPLHGWFSATQSSSYSTDGLIFLVYVRVLKDYGTETCGGYPGSLGHLTTDAQAGRQPLQHLQ